MNRLHLCDSVGSASDRGSSCFVRRFCIILAASHRRLQVESCAAGGSGGPVRCARLHLCDLAGSERQLQTGTQGVQLREAAFINSTLHVLRRVVAARLEQQRRAAHMRVQPGGGGSGYIQRVLGPLSTAGWLDPHGMQQMHKQLCGGDLHCFHRDGASLAWLKQQPQAARIARAAGWRSTHTWHGGGWIKACLPTEAVPVGGWGKRGGRV